MTLIVTENRELIKRNRVFWGYMEKGLEERVGGEGWYKGLATSSFSTWYLTPNPT